jgi:AhpD family alkylhydroperoxidase
MHTNPTHVTPMKHAGRLNFFHFDPEAMHSMEALEQRIARSDLDKPLAELARLRVAQVNGCAYCIDRHARDARALGLDECRITLLPVWRDTDLFSERERATLAWAEALTRVAEAPVPDGTWKLVEEMFVPSQLVDLTLVVTTTMPGTGSSLAFASCRSRRTMPVLSRSPQGAWSRPAPSRSSS